MPSTPKTNRVPAVLAADKSVADLVDTAAYPFTAAAVLACKNDLELVVRMRKLEDLYKDKCAKYDILKTAYSHLEDYLADPLFQPDADNAEGDL